MPAARSTAPEFVDRLLSAFAEETARPEPVRTDKGQQVLTEPLSEREAEILRLIAAGRSNPEIASLLYLSLNTVKWHIKNLYGKLSARSRVEAIARAQELDLL